MCPVDVADGLPAGGLGESQRDRVSRNLAAGDWRSSAVEFDPRFAFIVPAHRLIELHRDLVFGGGHESAWPMW